MTTLNMYANANGVGASVFTSRAGTTINLYSGVLRYNVTDGSTTTTVNILGGTLVHEAGAITTVN
ncbi:hypothetical protein, partial [Arthrobacter sp. PsM3]|uniref:hypothetical protein n=1 Tax=Arthrobacter sp. PsM3 TaxID=3030531 RepID=UPI00263AAB1A